MKATVCVLLLAAALVSGAEEKKNEKRGILGLGYGGYSAPLVSSHGYYGHGLGLYGHGGLGYGHGSLGYSHGGLGYGHGLGLGYGHGLGLGYGHSVAAPLVSHAPLAYEAYSAPLLGHGYVGHGWH